MTMVRWPFTPPEKGLCRRCGASLVDRTGTIGVTPIDIAPARRRARRVALGARSDAGAAAACRAVSRRSGQATLALSDIAAELIQAAPDAGRV